MENELEIRIKNAKRELESAEAELKKLQEKPDKNKDMSDFLFSMLKETKAVITGEKEITHYDLKTNEWLVQEDYKNGKLWVRYSLIWSVFESKFGLNHDQIRDFIKVLVETNLGWKGLTPLTPNIQQLAMVETNLGWKGLTPNFKIKN
jgi:hypothetical protein